MVERQTDGHHLICRIDRKILIKTPIGKIGKIDVKHKQKNIQTDRQKDRKVDAYITV